MDLIICVDNTTKYEKISAKCPFCGYVDDRLINDDYSDIPMIWCDGCGAHSFFKYPDETAKKQKTDYGYTITVPLIGILEVVETRLTWYKCPRKLNTEEVTSIINSWNTEGDYEKLSCEIVKKFDLTYAPYGITCDVCECDCGCNDCKCECGSENMNENMNETDYLNMSLPVNSYDVMKPLVPYPKKIDLSHDGIYIICKLETGEVVQYHGD